VLCCLLALASSACNTQQIGGGSAAEPSAEAAPTTGSSAPESVSPTAPDPLAGVYDEYVALGDSFTAGPLIAPPDPDGESCGRSLANYPNKVADRLQIDTLRDMSCSGADTTHLTTRQSNLFGENPPQLRALRPSTDLVTLGIGGNDFGVFGRLVVGCARVADEDLDGAPCRQQLSDLVGVFDQIQARITEALRTIQERSPDAEILLVGYPHLAPRNGTCTDELPFAAGDYGFARDLEQGLNDALRAAASLAEVEFVDVGAASAGHDACAGDEAWVNGRRAKQGEALSYHPFERGMTAVADLVRAELD